LRQHTEPLFGTYRILRQHTDPFFLRNVYCARTTNPFCYVLNLEPAYRTLFDNYRILR
jgi:hypothetical protein